MQTQLIQEKYKSQIKQMLYANEAVTVLSILKKVGTVDGRKYLSMLRNEGVRMSERWISTPTGKRCKEHKLIKD